MNSKSAEESRTMSNVYLFIPHAYIMIEIGQTTKVGENDDLDSNRGYFHLSLP